MEKKTIYSKRLIYYKTVKLNNLKYIFVYNIVKYCKYFFKFMLDTLFS